MIYLRGKSYWACYKEPDGVLVRRSLNTTIKVVAEEVYGKILNNIARGFVGLPTKEKAKAIPRLDAKILEYIENIKAIKSKPTAERYEYALKRFLTETKDIKYVTEVQKETIEGYVAKRIKDKVSPKTINDELKLARCFFKNLIENEYIFKNPAQGVQKLSYDPPEAVFFTKDVLQNLLENAVKPYDEVFAVLVDTGLRIGEFLNLSRTKDVDYIDGKIIVRKKDGWKPKTRSGQRQIPLTSRALDILRKWRVEAEKLKAKNDFVFYHEPIRSLRGEGRFSMLEYLKRLIKQIGGDPKGFCLHSFRHTFGSYAVMAQVDLSTVSKLMGHSSVQVTMRYYTHLTPVHEKEAMKKLETYQAIPCESHVPKLATA